MLLIYTVFHEEKTWQHESTAFQELTSKRFDKF